MNLLRQIPGIDVLLAESALEPCLAEHGRDLVLAELRRRVGALRQGVAEGRIGAEVLEDRLAGLATEVATALSERAAGRLVEVLNATGVVVHTNLGRAPLSAEALSRLADRGGQALALEFDLESGRRGRRAPGCEELLVELTGAEEALVVNNCAAALLLSLAALAGGRSVVVSRGELVEIGGSFRIPDICERAGAPLREVGTTNRTRLADYEQGSDDAGLLLQVHRSNFKVVGFTEDVPLSDLVALGRKRGLPVVVDQGSGILHDLGHLGLADERPVPEMVAAGADLVLFSGDKLLGGPQAGCLVGRKEAIRACRKDPLFRALRPGRLTLLALESTLWSHATGRHDAIPVLAQLGADPDELQRRCENLASALADAPVEAVVEVSDATPGGGAAPEAKLESRVVRLRPTALSETELAERLRRGRPPVIGRLTDGCLFLDLRTIPPERDGELARLVVQALNDDD
ncbi:MAG: L-seryl-tRNA(Sec) selenium transferase [Acidobacteriota bacterium]